MRTTKLSGAKLDAKLSASCATALPLFNTATPFHQEDTTTSSPAERYIFLSTLQLVQDDPEMILKRFAVFVADVTDSNDVAFSVHLTTGQAAVRVRFGDGEGVRSVEQATLSYEGRNKVLDFGISIEHEDEQSAINMETRAATDKFSVAICTDNSSDSAQICVACTKATVPPAAAKQLHHLVLGYLRCGEADTEHSDSAADLSIFNFPPVSEPLRLPWDAAVDTQVPSLLHTAFERRALEVFDRHAIDHLHRSSTGHVRTIVTYGDALARVVDIYASIRTVLATLDWNPVRGAQRVIPIFMAPCPELYLTILAILKSGNAFCPLPIDAPRQRLIDILEDINSPVVIGVGADPFASPTSTTHTSSSENKSLDRLWLDVSDLTAWPGSWNKSSVTRDVTLQPDDLAYVYYTSGSTGKPKGVQISHLAATCAISANAAAMPGLSAMQPLRWFQMAVPTFDAFILDVFFTFSAGGTLCVADRDMLLTDVEGAINALEANVTHTVPSLAMMMRKERMPTLKTMICIGEQLNSKVIDSFATNCSDASEGLVNIYGPTEATINVTAQIFKPDHRGSIIGEVLQTCSVVILDDRTLQPVPLGVPGHLAIGGPQLSHGYLNRPEENAKSFVDSPQFGRLYLTGDKARAVWNVEGRPVIECMGRINDGQVKLNGRRVELGEIDAVLMKSGALTECATLVLHEKGTVVLHTCAVAKPGGAQSEAEDVCRKTAAEHLPRWMSPARYFFFPSLARNVSGKVDRKALTSAIKELSQTQPRDEPFIKRPLPRYDSGYGSIHKTNNTIADAELPSILCAILKENLGCEISKTSSLFSVGFDSLQGIKLLQQARDFGVHELTISDLLKGPTPAQLANLIVSRRRKNDLEAIHEEKHGGFTAYASPQLDALLSGFDERCRAKCSKKIEIPPHEIDAVFPTTYMQTRMIATFQVAADANCPSAAKPWIEHFIFECPPSLDTHRFQAAVCTVLSRHDCFRSAFVRIDDPVSPFAQVILSKDSPAATLAFSNVYCAENMMEAQISNAQRAADDYIRLDRPPIAVAFIRSAQANRTVLVLSMFHGIYDGASLKLLREEIMAEYQYNPAPARTSVETAVRLHFGADRKKTMMFWGPKLAARPYFALAGVPNAPRAEAAPTSPATGSAMDVVSRLCTVRYGDLLVRSRANMQTTPLSVVQAAWALVLIECQQTMYTKRAAAEDCQPGSYDVTFGSTVHGRNDEASQICMGANITTIPVCMAGMTGKETNRNVCRILAVEHAEALGHLQLPCPSLEFALALPRFDTTLIFQTFGEGAPDDKNVVDFPGFEEGDDWKPAYRASDFRIPITIEILPAKNGAMKVMCTFTNDAPAYSWLDQAAAIILLDMLDTNLSWLLDHPETTFDYRDHGTA
ncbi:hypothetical protein CKM354_000439700 [Cercospora kikuchii]|uniref:Carrier domain-containing protein n=1 Tax=Cercospora kikuchii TaxID=84275 RepID=A0A9P3CE38_9PEZI|nr:uncharacterized protein CKM354_000439700 [Cercospora kikuchii]GIZ41081.1 hypothetical protein CKM354_000439700 [Cercospora kikuchii]